MKIIKKINILIFLLFIILIQMFIASLAFAQAGGGNPCGGGGNPNELPNPLDACTFEELVSSIATWFELIMVPVATIMILYAAFLFMTSGGDEEKIKRAKRAITWAVVGVAIVLIGAGFITLIKSFLSK